MADNGVRTTDLTPDTLLDDVMGNREGSLVRVTMSNLAAQLAASGEIAARIDEVEALVTTGARLAATWAALVSASGEFDGQGGEVLDADTGTHSQATATGYDGTTVPNAGRYVWSDGWSRWVRLGDTGLAGKADLAALDAEASAREGGDDALSAELAKLGLYKAQAVSFTDGAYRHRTTGVQESVSGLATGVVSPVTPGEVGRFTSSITGSAGAVASIVFLTAGDVVVSSVAAAPGVGTTKAYTREPFTVPAGAVKLAYTVLSSEIGTALLEIRRNTSGALAQARDDLDEIIGATQGFAVVEAAVTVGRYWHYSTGVFTALGSTYRALDPIPVEAGETIKVTKTQQGTPTALVVWQDAEGDYWTYTDQSTGTAQLRDRYEVVVPAGAHFACVDSYGTTPIVEKVGWAAATRDDVAEVQGQVTRLRGVADYWAGTEWVWNGTSIPYGSGGVSYPQRVAELLGATVQNKTIPSSACRIGVPEGVSADDPYGWTGMPFNNVIRAFSATRAEKQSFIDDYLSKWKARVTGGPSAIGAEGTPSAAEILDMSYETLLVPYLDADLFVFDHFRNDAAVSVSGTSGSEVTVIPGVDVTADAVGDPVTTRDRRWAIGAANYIFDVIRNANPRARIVIFGHYENTRDPFIAQAQQYLADLWGIPIVPLWSRLGWSSQTAQVEGSPVSLLDIWMADGIHPVSDPDGEATELIAQAGAPFIRDIR